MERLDLGLSFDDAFNFLDDPFDTGLVLPSMQLLPLGDGMPATFPMPVPTATLTALATTPSPAATTPTPLMSAAIPPLATTPSPAATTPTPLMSAAIPAPATTQNPSSPAATSSVRERCPVPSCKQHVFSRLSALRRHWLIMHMASIIMWLCPVVGCRFKNPRDDKVKEHCAVAHKELFKSNIDRLEQMKKLPRVLVGNNRFVDPKGISPPSAIGKVIPPVLDANAPSAPYLSKTSQPPTKKRKVEAESSSDTDMNILTPSKINITLPNISPKSVMNNLSTRSKGDILKEFYKNEHYILALQKRNTILKKELKRLEMEEVQAARKKLFEQEDTIQGLRDELRKKDRRLRHIEADRS